MCTATLAVSKESTISGSPRLPGVDHCSLRRPTTTDTSCLAIAKSNSSKSGCKRKRCPSSVASDRIPLAPIVNYSNTILLCNEDLPYFSAERTGTSLSMSPSWDRQNKENSMGSPDVRVVSATISNGVSNDFDLLITDVAEGSHNDACYMLIDDEQLHRMLLPPAASCDDLDANTNGSRQITSTPLIHLRNDPKVFSSEKKLSKKPRSQGGTLNCSEGGNFIYPLPALAELCVDREQNDPELLAKNKCNVQEARDIQNKVIPNVRIGKDFEECCSPSWNGPAVSGETGNSSVGHGNDGEDELDHSMMDECYRLLLGMDCNPLDRVVVA